MPKKTLSYVDTPTSIRKAIDQLLDEMTLLTQQKSQAEPEPAEPVGLYDREVDRQKLLDFADKQYIHSGRTVAGHVWNALVSIILQQRNKTTYLFVGELAQGGLMEKCRGYPQFYKDREEFFESFLEYLGVESGSTPKGWVRPDQR
jgi:hypothetical protein